MPEDKMTLGELLKHISFENVHLTHIDEEIELATIVELNNNTLTGHGKEAWKDVLNAKVTRIFEGGYGLQIECDEVSPERLSDFSYVLAGHVGNNLYNTWVNNGSDVSQEEPTMNM